MSLEHLNWEDDCDVTPKSETLSSDNLTTPSSTTPPNLEPTNGFRPVSRMSRLDRLDRRTRRQMVDSSPSDYDSSPPTIVYPNDSGNPRVHIRTREIPPRTITPTPDPGLPPLYRQYYVLCGECACSLEGRMNYEYIPENN